MVLRNRFLHELNNLISVESLGSGPSAYHILPFGGLQARNAYCGRGSVCINSAAR